MTAIIAQKIHRLSIFVQTKSEVLGSVNFNKNSCFQNGSLAIIKKKIILYFYEKHNMPIKNIAQRTHVKLVVLLFPLFLKVTKRGINSSASEYNTGPRVIYPIRSTVDDYCAKNCNGVK